MKESFISYLKSGSPLRFKTVKSEVENLRKTVIFAILSALWIAFLTKGDMGFKLGVWIIGILAFFVSITIITSLIVLIISTFRMKSNFWEISNKIMLAFFIIGTIIRILSKRFRNYRCL